MTLTQLYYFRAAAREMNFHRAAEQLMISQPSLSSSVSSLEQELGIKLFRKKGRFVTLTKYGTIYQKEIETILGRLDLINGQIRCAAQLGEGKIDLGYIAPLSSKFVPELVRAFLQHPEYARVTFGLQELPTPELLTGLKQYRHDVVFCIQDSSERDVEFVPILKQELVAIVPLDSPFAETDGIMLQQLAPYPFITYMPHISLYQEILGYIQESGFTPHIFCDATNEASIAALVANGFGVAVVAKNDILEHYKIKILHLKDRVYQRTIYMAYRKHEEHLPSLNAFLQFVLSLSVKEREAQTLQ